MKWAGSRDKIFSPSGRGRTFFLTSLFIELIDHWGQSSTEDIEVCRPSLFSIGPLAEPDARDFQAAISKFALWRCLLLMNCFLSYGD